MAFHNPSHVLWMRLVKASCTAHSHATRGCQSINGSLLAGRLPAGGGVLRTWETQLSINTLRRYRLFVSAAHSD